MIYLYSYTLTMYNTKYRFDFVYITQYAIILGDVDLVNVLCDIGANIHMKDNDGMDAWDYATKCRQYKIIESLYYQKLDGSLGEKLKEIAMKIQKMDKQAASNMKFDTGKHVIDETIEYIIQAMNTMDVFGQGTCSIFLLIKFCCFTRFSVVFYLFGSLFVAV